MRSTAARSTVKPVKRRWFFHVMYDMLSVRSGTEPDLMCAARVNPQQLQRYLAFLISSEMLRKEVCWEGQARYATTQRGENVLSKLQKIIGLLDIEGLDAGRM